MLVETEEREDNNLECTMIVGVQGMDLKTTFGR